MIPSISSQRNHFARLPRRASSLPLPVQSSDMLPRVGPSSARSLAGRGDPSFLPAFFIPPAMGVREDWMTSAPFKTVFKCLETGSFVGVRDDASPQAGVMSPTGRRDGQPHSNIRNLPLVDEELLLIWVRREYGGKR